MTKLFLTPSAWISIIASYIFFSEGLLCVIPLVKDFNQPSEGLILCS